MPHGIKVKEIIIGTGVSAGPKSIVVVQARGFLNRGEMIFDTAEFRTPLTIELAKREVVAGLRKGIVGMCVGGKREILVSPHLGYGEKGIVGKVPPNAVLRFEVELLQVREVGAVYPEDFPQGKQMSVFHPGELKTNNARWQFSATDTGVCGAFVTFPPIGTTWRYARPRPISLTFSILEVQKLFESAEATARLHPGEILSNDELWADPSEKGNSITRSQKTDEACVTISVLDLGRSHLHYAIPQSCAVLLNAEFYRVISNALAPYLQR